MAPKGCAHRRPKAAWQKGQGGLHQPEKKGLGAREQVKAPVQERRKQTVCPEAALEPGGLLLLPAN